MNDKKTEALKLALEALEDAKKNHGLVYVTELCAIKEALAEQPAQQDPVAYAVYHRMGGSKTLHWPEQHSEDGDHNEYQLVPLYTSPPASKPWVGLTETERKEIYRMAVYVDGAIRLAEAKLKEKNT